MAVVLNTRGTSISSFQVGKRGPIIKNNSGIFEFRNSDDSDYVEVKGAFPNSSDSFTTKEYVDLKGSGLAIKRAVRAATTGPLANATYDNQDFTIRGTTTDPLPAQDGVTLVNGDRLLVKDQTLQIENGIYEVTSIGGGGNQFILTRASDADNSPTAEIAGGTFCFVQEGTQNGDTGWVISSPDGNISIGTDNIVFTKFTGDINLTASNGIARVIDDLQLDLTSLVSATITSSDELVFVDVSDSNNEKKTSVSNFLNDLNLSNGPFLPLSGGTLTGNLIIDTNVIISNSNGTSTNPSYSFTNSSNTGFYLPSANNIGIVFGGVADDHLILNNSTGLVNISADGTETDINIQISPKGNGGVVVGTAAGPTIISANDNTTGESLEIKAGSGTAGDGGDITLTAGLTDGSGVNGSIIINSSIKQQFPSSSETNYKSGLYILKGTTTDATITELFVNTSSRLVLSDDSTWIFHIKVVARRTDVDDESAGYEIKGVIDRNSGAASTALVGALQETVIAEDSAAWAVTVDADTTNGSLRIQVTGEASKTIRWVAVVETIEVIG